MQAHAMRRCTQLKEVERHFVCSGPRNAALVERVATGGVSAFRRSYRPHALRSQHPRTAAAANNREEGEQEGTASCSGRTDHMDPFVAAATRLQSLVRGCGDSEDTLLDTLVANESPETKLQNSTVLAGLVCLASIVISHLCRVDPWGGASLDLNSLSWAAVGGLACLPFVALRLLSWSPYVARVLPVVDDMHRQQLQLMTPWLSGMNKQHVVAMMMLEVLPMLLLLLPATQGVLSAWCGSLVQFLDILPADTTGGFLGDSDQQTQALVIRAAGLLLTAAVTGIGQGVDLSVSEEEEEVVEAAVASADRYYVVTSTDMHSRAADAAYSSLAFKCVAKVWLENRNQASLLAGGKAFVDVLSLGCLWYMTGNLAAPAVAALATNWVDYHHLHQAVEDQELAVGKNGSSQV